MSTTQQLLDDINLRYRNTFTTAQKLVWMNEEQRELFEVLELDSAPYAFTLVAVTYFYPIPSDVEIEKIKTITIQVNAQGNYWPLPFVRNDDCQQADLAQYWYTIVGDNFYINVPGGATTGRNVYVYFDKSPTEISDTALSVEPSTPKKFQEVLKLGVLERIAAARKDVDMKNNFASDKENKITDFIWSMKMSEPEFMSPIDVLPKAGL